MKIFVCVKQVPDTETKIKLGADSIDTTGMKWVMNPYDEFAVEESIKIRDANPGSQVFAMTVGPKARVADVLRTALAMGADEGIVINAAENLDSYAIAKAIAAAIQAEGGAGLVLTGKLAIDQNAASVSQMVAEFLKIPHATVVSKITIDGDRSVVERDIEGGAKEVITLQMPSVIGANKGLNMPRYASLPGIMKAKKKVLKELEASALGISDSDIKIKMSGFRLPADKPAVKMIAGDVQQQVTQLTQLLRDEAKVL